MVAAAARHRARPRVGHLARLLRTAHWRGLWYAPGLRAAVGDPDPQPAQLPSGFRLGGPAVHPLAAPRRAAERVAQQRPHPAGPHRGAVDPAVRARLHRAEGRAAGAGVAGLPHLCGLQVPGDR